jgi:hypothetical protein
MNIQQNKVVPPKKIPFHALQPPSWISDFILFYFIFQFCDIGEVMIIDKMGYSQIGYKENESKKI